MDHAQLKVLFMRYGLRLLSATESLDDTSAGKLMENQLAGFVQFDNDIRNERCRNGIGWSRPWVQAGTSGGSPEMRQRPFKDWSEPSP